MSKLIQCMKCKKKTGNKGPVNVSRTVNGRYRAACHCTHCGASKGTFVSAAVAKNHQSGGNLLGTILGLLTG